MPLPIYYLNEVPLNASYSSDQHLPFFLLYLLVKSFSLIKLEPSFFFNIRASGFKESPQVLVFDSSHSSHQFYSCVNLNLVKFFVFTLS
jgi:hypothetical protein